MFVDVQIQQLNKTGEELCGDSIGWHRGNGETVLVLADGLGSGVKANILSTLTQKIALTMFREHLPVNEVVETLAATLPTCQVRQLAYSTFTLVRIDDQGEADIVEFDNPPTFVFKNNVLESIERTEWVLGNYKLQQAHCQLNEGDCLVVASDGLIHAGIGGVAPLGWRWEPIAEHLQAFLWQDPEAEEIAENLVGAASGLYRGRVGDDTSVAVLKCRPFREIVLAVGPPANRDDDQAMAQRFINTPGMKVVCGGTTAKLIARELCRPLEVDLSTAVARDLPPAGKIEGIDLVTEGVITIMHAIDELATVRLRKPRANVHDLQFMYGQRDYRSLIRDNSRITAVQEEENPAQVLARHLRLADKVTILLGRALNPAHQNPNLPIHLGLKLHLVEHLAEKLRERGKDVNVITY
ncbi:MAG TPA: SpoIIE family protein phosphatase [Armatimonadota bacterium]|nr:SpoIIE family protein phosphatase [Armatimonadota bacterium]